MIGKGDKQSTETEKLYARELLCLWQFVPEKCTKGTYPAKIIWEIYSMVLFKVRLLLC